MNRVLSVSAYLVRKLWLLCAIVLVLFAVLLSVLRYTLPYLDEEKHLIEDYKLDILHGDIDPFGRIELVKDKI